MRSWHSPETWPNGLLPSASADVVLPAASQVLISQSVVEELGLITIPSGSELIIGRTDAGSSTIRLHAKGLVVHGALRAGSATCRLQSPIEITLHGARPASRAARDSAPPASKGIFVSGGTLDLHGKLYHRTWARLARRVAVGDRAVLLQARVNWEVQYTPREIKPHAEGEADQTRSSRA